MPSNKAAGSFGSRLSLLLLLSLLVLLQLAVLVAGQQLHDGTVGELSATTAADTNEQRGGLWAPCTLPGSQQRSGSIVRSCRRHLKCCNGTRGVTPAVDVEAQSQDAATAAAGAANAGGSSKQAWGYCARRCGAAPPPKPVKEYCCAGKGKCRIPVPRPPSFEELPKSVQIARSSLSSEMRMHALTAASSAPKRHVRNARNIYHPSVDTAATAAAGVTTAGQVTPANLCPEPAPASVPMQRCLHRRKRKGRRKSLHLRTLRGRRLGHSQSA